MRILILSDTGCALGMVSHLEKEGHGVSVATTPPQDTSYTIAISDSHKYVQDLASMEKNGVRTLGTTRWTSLIDTNEEYRNNLITALGYEKAKPEERGERVIVVSWFNGNKFVSRFIVFNYSKFLSGDLGTTVPSSGYAAYFGCSSSRLVKEITSPLYKFLRKANHKGVFCVECVVNYDGIKVNDVSASMHVPYPHLIYENSRMSKTDVLSRVMNELSEPIQPLSLWSAGVLVSVYPFPYAKPKTPVAIQGVSQANLKHSWIIDLERKGDAWYCGNKTGCFGYVTARGETCPEATKRIYRTLKQNLYSDTLQYRTDIGKDIYKRFSRLVEYGAIAKQ